MNESRKGSLDKSMNKSLKVSLKKKKSTEEPWMEALGESLTETQIFFPDTILENQMTDCADQLVIHCR